MTKPKSHSPHVQALADRYGVDLSTITGTGAGGRISVKDVTAAAHRPGGQLHRTGITAAPRAAATPTRHLMQPGRPKYASSENTMVDAYARNPLADEYKAYNPAMYAQIVTEQGAPPTLFESGDLPPFTASGQDSSVLLSLPWQARHAFARANQQSAVAIYEAVGGTNLEVATLQAQFDYADDAGNLAYYERFTNWLSGTLGAAAGIW